jgi:hypothetical protein
MRFNQSEIVEDVLAHVRQAGGEFSDWCVGAGVRDWGLGVRGISRQAYTSYAAAEVAERLVSLGLRRARGSAPGHIVFVYRPAEAQSDPAEATPVATSSPRHGDVKSPLPRAA